PPAAKHQPDEVAERAERSGAEIAATGIVVARHHRLAEGQERVPGDVEGGARPRQADDGDRHDERGDEPAERHPPAAEDDPEDIEKQAEEGHVGSLSLSYVVGSYVAGSAADVAEPAVQVEIRRGDAGLHAAEAPLELGEFVPER